ncbi:MAG: plastocyanin/azurin family copper-binding protein [Nitriliruptorales bacterium]|nr:plastocyanin/azurin family copper-binding protein [Nitriliruptorales bacterium]
MRTTNTRRTGRWLHHLVLVTTVALLAAACGGTDTDTTTDTDSTPTAAETTDDMAMDDMGSETEMASDGEMDMDMSGTYGEPADPSEADRTIEVNVDNDLAFEPADLTVAVGEVITFRITNTGQVEHEFVLGDEEAQQEMAEMMESGDDHAHSGEMSNAVTVHAGETAELTWRFTQAGTVLIGCHVPGHYDAGMTGTVTIEG